MIFSLFRNGFSTETFILVLLSVPVILFALTTHECCHGLAAGWMGDHTARNLGRLTLNPAKHLDLIGTIMMFIFGFGWAKPVPVNTRNFRNPKWGMAITALAGPISNFLCAYIFYILCTLVGAYLIPSFTSTSTAFNIAYALYLLLFVAYNLNLTLAIFNLLPVPPLDGSRILFVFLPSKAYFAVMKYERYISIGIMVLLFTGWLSAPLNFLRDQAIRLFSLTVKWMV